MPFVERLFFCLNIVLILLSFICPLLYNFVIKKYFAEPETFVKEINSVKSLKFVSMDKNFFNVGIFNEAKDILGYGDNLYNLTVEVKVEDYGSIK